jgi:hypothetical protein
MTSAGGLFSATTLRKDVTAIAAAHEFRLWANHKFAKGFVAGPAIAGFSPRLRQSIAPPLPHCAGPANEPSWCAGRELRSGHDVFGTLGPFERLDHDHVGGRDPNASCRKKFDNAVGVHTGVLGNAGPNRLSLGNVRIVLRHGSIPAKKTFSVTAKRAKKGPV